MSLVEVEVVTKETLKLKACPFCAEAVTLNVVHESEPYVDCSACKASGPTGVTVKEAVVGWNTRRRQTKVTEEATE